ncbi:hypothetical protein FRC03_009340 [Tulasnella sp. 419]|nr:hypothetical protein FRC03_009340 [Tulasnella sp. 419]
MPSRPTISSKTFEYRKYRLCERHLRKRKSKTENHIRTYGCCPCFQSCSGIIHEQEDREWTVCLDKKGNGRCDHPSCTHFYLDSREGYVDVSDGACYWLDDDSPVECGSDNNHLHMWSPVWSPPPPRRSIPSFYSKGSTVSTISTEGDLTDLFAQFPHNKAGLRYFLLSCFATTSALVFLHSQSSLFEIDQWRRTPPHAHRILAECASLRALPGPPPGFQYRTQSDRFVHGTKPQLILNATIWTGGKDGTEVITGDVFLEDGLIKAVGDVPKKLIHAAGAKLVVHDAEGAWVTPGIFDIHSHMTLDGLPELRGTDDTNSFKGLTLPWMRSLDGLNLHDESLKHTVAGGVTTALILPGSADAIGGQAFVIKTRLTDERSPSSMVLEPPFSLNGTDPTQPPRWRHMKHATGENPSRVYDGTRMDTMWAFREAYNEARKVKEDQEKYCAMAESGLWSGLASSVPKSLKWEALVDVLRGKVKINIHSYSPSDFDGLVRLSNEFKFPIAALHHAHEAYLVTPLLRKFYGGKPAIAMFATNARYKVEAYRGSEYAPKILDDAGFKVIFKSDHPVLNSRYLLYEAQQGHLYGLPSNKAIQSVTTTPAAAAGFGHRLGYVALGYDADVVVWDSHPLALGATPRQVYIDGIPQLESPALLDKPSASQIAPTIPDRTKEAEDALKYDGLPPLKPTVSRNVVFVNVNRIWTRGNGSVESRISKTGVAHFIDGKLVCSSFDGNLPCPPTFGADVKVIDLEGGSLAPGLTSFGGYLGVMEIEQEPSTNDGVVYSPFSPQFSVLGDVARAADGLSFEGRSMLLAYRAGVTSSVAAPLSRSMFSGLSVAFSNGAAHALEEGAIVKEIAALHIQISAGGKGPSVSTQIGLLRRLLTSKGEATPLRWFTKVASGELPLIIHTHSADIIAKILKLKQEVEAESGDRVRLAFFGGLESHLVAREIAEAGAGVIVSPPRAFPLAWQSRRVLPGPPLTEETVISTLLRHNVTVGIGIVEGWEARNTRFDLIWAALEANGRISREQALALATTNLEQIFGISSQNEISDIVAYKGGDVFDFSSEVVAVISSRSGRIGIM